MPKKLFYSLAFVFLGCSLFLLGYWFNGSEDNAIVTNTSTALISRFLKPTETFAPYASIDQLPGERVTNPKLSLDGHSIVYYDPISGYLHRIELSESGNKNLTLQKLRPYLKNLRWSWDRQLLLGSDGSKELAYDLATNTSRTLPETILNPTLASFADQSAYLGLDSDTGTTAIGLSDSHFNFFKKLLPTTPDNWQLSWLNDHTLSLLHQNGKLISLFALDTQTKALSKLLTDRQDLLINWSPDGQQLLYSFRDNAGLSTKIINFADVVVSIPKAVLASSCVWSIDSVTFYCGGESGFFSFNSKDQTLQSLKTDNSLHPKIETPFLSLDEKYLFFVDSADQTLYRLRIQF